VVDEFLSTRQMGWVLDRSANAVRTMIRQGEIQSVRLPAGFRVPRAEAVRVARQRVKTEAGRKVSDRELERLIDEVISTNEHRT